MHFPGSILGPTFLTPLVSVQMVLIASETRIQVATTPLFSFHVTCALKKCLKNCLLLICSENQILFFNPHSEH